MSKKSVTITALALSLIAFPIAVAAGGHFHKGGPGGPDGPGGGFFGGHGPGLERFLDHAACMLDLSDEQEAQIDAIIEASRPQMDALREQAAEARDAFHEAFDPGAFDEAAVTAFAQGQSELHTQMMVLGLQTFSQVWTVLTPEQRQQLEEMHGTMQERRQSHRGDKRFGR
jgi:Spy/CpxP family protein refolding chaperone